MLLATLVSLIYKDGVTLELLLSGLAVLLMGLSLMLSTKNHSKQMNKREGYMVVTFGWIVMAVSGALPYMVTEVIPSFTSAFFETMSGYTTTGATILNDIEVVPKGILDWWHGNYCIGHCHFALIGYWWHAIVCCRGSRP